MTTVNVYRKPAPRYANDLTSNESVHSILENSEQGWTELSSKLHGVADMTPKNEYGPSTSLGKGIGFMTPFVDAMDVYDALYSVSSWCRRSEDQELIGVDVDPVTTRSQRIDVSFAEKVEVTPGGNVIVIGDIHAGIHSFVEILDNLFMRGILMDDFRLKSGYKIVFLGDIVDRGSFGLDILHIVFRLKNINFQDVHICNGNHEDKGMYDHYGFGDEVKAQLPDENDQEIVHMLLTYLPSVIFLNMNNKWIQMNHGGIEPTYNPIEFINSEYEYEFHGFDGEPGLFNMGLRWNDFNGYVSGIGVSGRGSSVSEYGPAETELYLSRNSLSGIIRGHQDFYHCGLLPKMNVNFRDMSLLEEVGMLFPDTSHWCDKFGSWEKVGIADSFKDFSVVTTSTAQKARNLGYHCYLEITSSPEDIKQAKKSVNKNIESYIGFMRNLDIEKEFLFLISSNPMVDTMVSDKIQRWNVAMDQMKNDQRGDIHYSLLFLNSFGSITGNVTPIESSS